jgi:hypothetical protein
MFLLITVVIPLAFVVVMNLLEGLVEQGSWQGRCISVGWDTTVLALGVTAGTFTNPGVLSHYTPQVAVTIEISVLLLSLLSAVLMCYLRRNNPYVGWKALVSLALGGLALSGPVYISYAYT